MVCKICGKEINENAKYCDACGAAVESVVEEPVAQPVSVPYTEPQREKPITEEDLPDHLRPMSPWAYFGLTLLYSVPIVGFVFLIVFSISRGNINRRNFTRSYWCSLIIVAVILLVIMVMAGGAVFTARFA